MSVIYSENDSREVKYTILTHDSRKRKLRHADSFSFGDLLNPIIF